MKKLFVYYLLIFIPIIPFVLCIWIPSFRNRVNPIFGGVYILVYALIYHPIISGFRLLALGKIRRKEFFYNFIPAWNLKYFEYLFLKK